MTETITLEHGCYSEGSRGIYAIERLAELVGDLATEYAETDQYADDSAIIQHHLHGDQGATITISTGQEITVSEATDIALGELYDELTGRLPATDGNIWIWSDGELFYWPYDQITENGEITDEVIGLDPTFLKYANDRFAWPGGYELFFVTDDAGVLCAQCVIKEWSEVIRLSDPGDGWHIVAYDHLGNTDDLPTCDHCYRTIGEST